MDKENYLLTLIGGNYPVSEKAQEAYSWIEKQGDFTFNVEESRELGGLIYRYLMHSWQKGEEEDVNATTTETYDERLNKKAIPYAQKLTSLLMEGNMSQKGISLALELINLQIHPEEYLYKPKKVYANFDDIKAFFSKISVEEKEKKELFSILKN